MTAVAVVLAAGAGSRFAGDSHKLLALWRGRPLVAWAVEHAQAGGLAETWVVTGAVPLAGLLPASVRLLDNPRWADGQSTSLQVAVAAATGTSHDAIVVGLGDQPLVQPAAWAAVAASNAAVAVATYDGRRRNPVRLGRAVWPLLPTNGDEGARVLLRDRPELALEVPCEGDPVDIDTVEDLTRWN
jgi:molybdenum cofactor cytidylyltransferase